MLIFTNEIRGRVVSLQIGVVIFSNQPFKLSFSLPASDDKRTRGYSPKFIEDLLISKSIQIAI